MKALFPPGSEAPARALGLLPGIAAGAFAFVARMTGSNPDGSIPAEDADKFRQASDKIGAVLAQAGLTFGAVIDMKRCHIGRRAHGETFNRVRRACVCDPFPASTAVEVADLRHEGAVGKIRGVEMRKQN